MKVDLLGEVLLTPLDASRILGVSTDSVRYYAKEGKLPTIMTVGGRHLFRRSDVDELAVKRAAKKAKVEK